MRMPVRDDYEMTRTQLYLEPRSAQCVLTRKNVLCHAPGSVFCVRKKSSSTQWRRRQATPPNRRRKNSNTTPKEGRDQAAPPNKEGKKLKKKWKKSKTRKRAKTQREGKKKRENSEDEARTTRECFEPLKNKKKNEARGQALKGTPVPKTGLTTRNRSIWALFPHTFFFDEFRP